MKRVIVVIPYTSIIEQNAAEYKKALGDSNVIEHHSNYDPYIGKTETDADRYQMATENWDAPVIVTTSVQFFQTLFASRPSICRKLHNIAHSVIILDEVQTLPPGFLSSIVEVLTELVCNYGCSIVLSTATQPALLERPDFKQGLKGVRKIIADPQELSNSLQRVRYHWPDMADPAENWMSLASRIVDEKQVLVIVDRRKDARELAYEIKNIRKDEPIFHLSALMCPAHRLDVIKQIQIHLNANLMCRVISTQVVEAGVDLDFPVVYRAMAGLSSIIQAAGRCNREGQMKQGNLIIFKPPHEPPAGVMRTSKQITESMLEIQGFIDPDNLLTIEKYFQQLYFTQDLDAQRIQPEREQFNYANVGRDFQLIEDGFTKSIVVPYGEAPNILADIKRSTITRGLLRRLQAFTVSIYPEAFSKLLSISEMGHFLNRTLWA